MRSRTANSSSSLCENDERKRTLKLARSEFDLPETLNQALAGNTRGLSFSSATWGVRFPQVDDLAILAEGGKIRRAGSGPDEPRALTTPRINLLRSRPCRPRPQS